jgi:hypothetical protein
LDPLYPTQEKRGTEPQRKSGKPSHPRKHVERVRFSRRQLPKVQYGECYSRQSETASSAADFRRWADRATRRPRIAPSLPAPRLERTVHTHHFPEKEERQVPAGPDQPHPISSPEWNGVEKRTAAIHRLVQWRAGGAVVSICRGVHGGDQAQRGARASNHYRRMAAHRQSIGRRD